MKTWPIFVWLALFAPTLPTQTDWIRAKHFTGNLGASAMAFDASRGRTVLFGSVGATDLTPETWEWDGVSWSLRAPATSPGARRGSVMAYDPSRRTVILFGGETAANTALGDTWEWNGAEWRILSPALAPPARSHHGMVTDTIRGCIVLYGGGGRTDTWEWSNATWTRKSTPSVPAPSATTAIAFDAARGVVLLQSSNPSLPARTWAYDGNTWIAHTTATGPMDDREGMAMEYDAERERIVLFGGLTRYENLPPVNLTWTWDGLRWSMVSGSPQPPLRGDHRMVYDSLRKRIVMHGGRRLKSVATTSVLDTWEWDGVVWREVNSSHTPPWMLTSSMARDTVRDKVVLVGWEPYPFALSTWEWDGVQWNSTVSTRAPSRRRSAAIAYDSDRRRTVLFGGDTYPYPYHDDTWEWDGSQWTTVGSGPRPSPRGDHAMAYDSMRKTSVLFGGYGDRGFEGDTWLFDGTTWRIGTSSQGPMPRSMHAMAYDSRRGVVVLLGGITRSSKDLEDTWEWNGQGWQQRFPAHWPPSRFASAMTYDASRGVCILHGGLHAQAELADTWEWDGMDWQQARTTTSPGTRSNHSMAYDERRKQTILFGHANGATPVNEETWIYSLASTSPPARATTLGTGCAGTNGTSTLSASQPLLGRPKVDLDLISARANAVGTIAIAATSQTLPIGGGCTLYLGPAALAPALRTSAIGFATVGLPMPSDVTLRGLTLYAQAFVLDPNGFANLALSPGLELVLGY